MTEHEPRPRGGGTRAHTALGAPTHAREVREEVHRCDVVRLDNRTRRLPHSLIAEGHGGGPHEFRIFRWPWESSHAQERRNRATNA
jgi:hypothetical protein